MKDEAILNFEHHIILSNKKSNNTAFSKLNYKLILKLKTKDISSNNS